MTWIHYVDPTDFAVDLRPVCGAWSDDITWTTVRAVMTCPACARLVRVARPERRPTARVLEPDGGRPRAT